HVRSAASAISISISTRYDRPFLWACEAATCRSQITVTVTGQHPTRELLREGPAWHGAASERLCSEVDVTGYSFSAKLRLALVSHHAARLPMARIHGTPCCSIPRRKTIRLCSPRLDLTTGKVHQHRADQCLFLAGAV